MTALIYRAREPDIFQTIYIASEKQPSILLRCVQRAYSESGVSIISVLYINIPAIGIDIRKNWCVGHEVAEAWSWLNWDITHRFHIDCIYKKKQTHIRQHMGICKADTHDSTRIFYFVHKTQNTSIVPVDMFLSGEWICTDFRHESIVYSFEQKLSDYRVRLSLCVVTHVYT